MEIKKALFLKRELYLEIMPDTSNQSALLDIAGTYLEKEYKIIQLNQCGLSDFDYLSLSRKVRQLTSFYDSLFIVQNRVDIAILSEADGILLNDNSINLSDVKKLIHADIITGCDKINNELDFDFYVTEIFGQKTGRPTYYKIRTENNVNIYKSGEHGYNK